MRCYYELLDVSRDVASAELKKAYYKMSLQWHPDKNSSKDEDTTAVFQQIQEAYRVLSDPHERAWYDSHRAQILQSGGRNAQKGATNNTEFQEDRIDVFQYFTRSCYCAFDDTENGFYTVYRILFDRIMEEELRACETGAGTSCSDSSVSEDDYPPGSSKENGDFRRRSRYPTFGHSDSSYADVVAPFYQYWELFRTKKHYTWVEKYDIRCADSRPERRAMEVENRKLREAARKQRNEEIRELVSHVKKRDKRVAAERIRVQLFNQEAQARSQQMAKEYRQRSAAQLAEAWNEELAFGGVAAQWMEDFETELARIEAELDGHTRTSHNIRTASEVPTTSPLGEEVDEEEELSDNYADNFYCLACDKAFASLKAKLNHESSKKHRKQAELLRNLLIAEDEAAAASPSDGSVADQSAATSRGPSQQMEAVPKQVEVKLTKRAKKAQRERLKLAEKEKTATESVLITHNIQEINSVNDESAGRTDEVDKVTRPLPKVNNVDDTEIFVKPNTETTMCETCGLDLLSRNKLFAHLKETGHAKLKLLSSKPSKSGGRKKR